MKTKRYLRWLLLAAVLMLAGCGSKQEEEAGYKIYYVNTSGTSLAVVRYSPSAETFDEMMAELMGQLGQAPSGYISALPDTVRYNGYERGIDALRIDFSEEYYDMDNVTEVLLRAAVVKTFCQIPGVAKVMITVGGEQLTDADGRLVEAMGIDSFIDTKGGGINSYQYATLTLYFGNQAGDQIVEETRELYYSSNMLLQRVVVEQLISGPEGAGLQAVLGSNVQIENLYVQNGICIISFDAEADKLPSLDNTVDPAVALYAIVDSLCVTCEDITGVKFEIAGDSDVLFRGEVDLNQIFMINRQYIETEAPETEAQTY